MARNKSFVKRIFIDTVIKSHDCAHDKTHRLKVGEKRLKVKKDRSYQHYCVVCAVKFIDVDIEKLNKIKKDLLKFLDEEK